MYRTMTRLTEWEAKAWLAVLSGVIVGCVATVWMAVENEIDHYYRPTMDEIHLVADDAGVGDCPERPVDNGWPPVHNDEPAPTDGVFYTP